MDNPPGDHDESDKRSLGLRLRRYIDVVIEDQTSFKLSRGAIADLSPTGMRLIAAESLTKGATYRFTMKRSPFLQVHGEVRWVRSFERKTFQVGVLFVDFAEEDQRRLIAFLESERARVFTNP